MDQSQPSRGPALDQATPLLPLPPKMAAVAEYEFGVSSTRTEYLVCADGRALRARRVARDTPVASATVRMRRALASVFLPAGYPHSVSAEYIQFQGMLCNACRRLTPSDHAECWCLVWDTVQAICSYLRSILATRAILEGVGVGNGRHACLCVCVCVCVCLRACACVSCEV